MYPTNLIHETLQRHIDNGEIAGAAVRVHLNGELLTEASLGWSDIERRIPVTPKTVFWLCSMSKPVTAVLGMTLVEQGKLDLETPVMDLIPEFSHLPTLTVRMLFDHSSGILTGASGEAFQPAAQDTLAEHVARIARYPHLEFAPGTGTAYSPMGAFDVLGRIIEIASGMPFEDYLAEALTKPLGMVDTGFVPTPDQRMRTAVLYEYTPGWPLRDVTDTNGLMALIDPFRNRHYCGSGGMISTLDDYDRFTRMLLNDGELDGARILKPETVAQMHTPSAAHGLEAAPGRRWGLGMVIFEDNARSGRALYDGTYGWSGAYGTHFYVAPEQKLCMTLMVNSATIGGSESVISLDVEQAIYRTLNG